MGGPRVPLATEPRVPSVRATHPINTLTCSDVEELSTQGEQIPEPIPHIPEGSAPNHQARSGLAASHRRAETDDQAAFHADDHACDEADEDRSLIEGEPDPIVAHAARLPPLSVRETARLAIPFATVWFAANWSFVAAMGLTSVASGTTLGSTSGFLTLLLGTVCGTDRITPGKLFSVVLSTLGVFLVTRTDAAQQQPQAAGAHPVLGDALAIFSAVCYAVYATLLRVRIGSEERISMPLFLGFVGAFSVAAFWPLGVLLDLLGIERFSAPIDKLTWTGVLVNMLITVVSYVEAASRHPLTNAETSPIYSPCSSRPRCSRRSAFRLPSPCRWSWTGGSMHTARGCRVR